MEATKTRERGMRGRSLAKSRRPGMVEARGTSPALEDGTPGYLCEQFRVPRGCLGYVVADPATRLAAIVDPELKMVEPMVDFVFEHGLRPAYIIDTHTHADHVSGRRNLKSETAARLTMQEKAPSSVVGIRVEEGNRLHLGVLP
jgi:glyoxylase-like metal-dependent hydrolase (beta-lactamase superfamily II)